MKRLVITLVLAGILLIALAAPAGASTPVWQPRTVAMFSAGDYGAFAEGMAADRHGNLWVSLTSWGLYDDTVAPPLTTTNIGQIWKVTPGGVATLKATVDLTDSGMLLGVAIRQDHVFVALFDGGSGAIPNGVYRLRSGGKLSQVVSLDEGVWPNGIAFHGRDLYITDSANGAIWRARLGSGVTAVHKAWLKDDLLAPGDPSTDPTMGGIGANGIAFRGDHAYVSVADGARIVRIGVRTDGRHGLIHTVCEKPAP